MRTIYMTMTSLEKAFRVLLVDDSEPFLRTLEGFLSGDPRIHIVGKASSGEEALKRARETNPHLVLMDIAMPGQDGLLTARLLKGEPDPPRVIILTFYDNPEYRMAAEGIPVDGFLLKTQLSTHLLPLMNQIISQTTADRQIKETTMHTILIVDDSATMRRMVKASLTNIPGAVFLEASNGLEAIEKVAIQKVSLVLLDLNMPDMHGLEVLKFLRSHETYQQLPVIVLTTRGDDASRKAAEDAGASLYLTKPFDPVAFKRHVMALLGGNQ